MVTWEAFAGEAGELASFGRERLDRRVSFLATVRADGGPRVHPVTPWIAHGHLYVRMYATSPKVADLERDPRFAMHSMMDNDDGIGGEFALTGHAVRVDDQATVAAALASVMDLGDDRTYVLFEFHVEDVVSTQYEGERTDRQRWRAPAS